MSLNNNVIKIVSPAVKHKMDYDVLDRDKWIWSLDPGKNLKAILPLKKVLYDTHLQRIYEKWNGNSFKILLRDMVFLHNFFPSWTFMNVGWKGGLEAGFWYMQFLQVSAKGDIFPSKAICVQNPGKPSAAVGTGSEKNPGIKPCQLGPAIAEAQRNRD